MITPPGTTARRRSSPATGTATAGPRAPATGMTTASRAPETPPPPQQGIRRPEATRTGAAVVPPKPYDPTKPIDLGGVERRHARAAGRGPRTSSPSRCRACPQCERLPAAAEAKGFHSIDDGGTGYEHFINWDVHQRRARCSIPTTPSRSCTSTVDGKRTARGRDVHGRAGTTLDDGARRRRAAHAVAHPRQPVLHRRRTRRASPAHGSRRRRARPPLVKLDAGAR